LEPSLDRGLSPRLAFLSQPGAGGARVTIARCFDTAAARHEVAPKGLTLAQMIALYLPSANESIWPHLSIIVGYDDIDYHFWARYRPKPGAQVFIAIRAGKGGTLRAVLGITVALAALATGQIWAASLAPAIGLTGAAATVSGSLISAAVGVGGLAALNALVPPRQAQQQQAGLPSSPTYAVSGFRNAINPDGVFASIFGIGRYAPPMIIKPFTRVENGKTFFYCMFGLGYGPLNVHADSHRFGETPVDNFKVVQMEVREGWPDDPPHTLITNQPIENRLSINLRQAAVNVFGPHSRWTARRCKSFEVEVTCQQGLFQMLTQQVGTVSTTYPLPWTVPIMISYRREDQDTWTNIAWAVSGYSKDPVVFQRTVDLPDGDHAYEVRVIREQGDLDDLNGWQQYSQWSCQTWWTALRTFRAEYPVNMSKPIATVQMKIQGTEQLNGVIDDYNVIIGSIVKDWDAGSGTWVERESDNPASLCRHVLQGPMNRRAKPDSRIDLAQIEDEFHPHCVAENLKCFLVVDYKASIKEVLGDLAAVGRASPLYDGTKYRFAIDKRKDAPVAAVTAANAWGFGFSRPYKQPPEGIGVKFRDASADFRAAQRVVPWPGFVGTPTDIEIFERPGVCDPAQAYIEGYYLALQRIHRSDVFTATQFLEAAVYERGDRVALSYFTLDETQSSGYVRAVRNGAVVLDRSVTMEAGENYLAMFRKLATDENAAYDNFATRMVLTVAGEHDALFLKGAGVAPAEGDLFLFGPATRLALDVICIKKEPGEDLTVRSSFVPYAPEIFDALDAVVVPPWNGAIGFDISLFHPSLKWNDRRNSQHKQLLRA
jgi:hypothetical protein